MNARPMPTDDELDCGLAAEFSVLTVPMPDAMRSSLIARGVPEAVISRTDRVGCFPGPLSSAFANLSGAFFEPCAEGGELVAVLPVWAGAVDLPDDLPGLPRNFMLDLLAFDIGNPSRFWTRWGIATMLGDPNLHGDIRLDQRGDLVRDEPDPLPVYGDPVQWLAAPIGRGIVQLSKSPGARAHELRGWNRLAVMDDTTGRRILADFDAAFPRPTVLVAERRIAA